MRIVDWGTMRAAAIFAFFVVGGFTLPAADRPPVPSAPDVVVLVESPRQTGDSFGPLMADAATYKLGQVGLASRVVNATPVEAPLPRAAASGAPIALVCGYQVDEKQIAFTIGWYDAQAEASSIVVHARGRLDLDLDEVIFSALDEILDKVRDRVQALSAGRLRVVAGPSLPASRD